MYDIVGNGIIKAVKSVIMSVYIRFDCTPIMRESESEMSESETVERVTGLNDVKQIISYIPMFLALGSGSIGCGVGENVMILFSSSMAITLLRRG